MRIKKVHEFREDFETLGIQRDSAEVLNDLITSRGELSQKDLISFFAEIPSSFRTVYNQWTKVTMDYFWSEKWACVDSPQRSILFVPVDKLFFITSLYSFSSISYGVVNSQKFLVKSSAREFQSPSWLSEHRSSDGELCALDSGVFPFSQFS